MSRIDDILNQIDALLAEINELNVGDREDLVKLALKYESWYTRSRQVVQHVVPDRLQDFVSAYRIEKRKDITYESYTISDYLMGLVIRRCGEEAFDTKQAYQTRLLRQAGILKSAADIAPSVLRDISAVFRAEIFDSDMVAARELLKAGHLRPAGVLSGVVLEAHLKSTCARHNIKTAKKNPTISDCNEALRGASVYDVPMWRFIQRLGDIRNLCGHSKDRDPKRDEVEDLISGTDKVLKEVF